MYQELVLCSIFPCFLHFLFTQKFYTEKRASLMFSPAAEPQLVYTPLLATSGRENKVPGHHRTHWALAPSSLTFWSRKQLWDFQSSLTAGF